MKTGSVSWVVPGTYLENARALEPHVDFVELLVYTWDDGLRGLLEKELDGLRALDLFYTVHLPTDTIDNCARAWDFFRERAFPVANHSLHPLPGWEDFIRDREDVTLENLIDRFPVHPRMTVDIGHLRLSRTEDAVLGSPRLREVRELHLHGVHGGKDHVLLTPATLRYLEGLRRYPVFDACLSAPELLVNFEIFDLPRLVESLRRFTHAVPRDPAPRHRP